MAVFGRQFALRFTILLAAVALFAGPAHAFFPPVPVYIPVPASKTPITVPTVPPVTVPPVVTPPGGGGGGPPESAPEPNGLVLALLGGGGVSVFAACRRAKRKGSRKDAKAQRIPLRLGVFA